MDTTWCIWKIDGRDKNKDDENEKTKNVRCPDCSLQCKIPDPNFTIAGARDKLCDTCWWGCGTPDCIRMIIHCSYKWFCKHFIEFDSTDSACVFTRLFKWMKTWIFIFLKTLNTRHTLALVVCRRACNGFNFHCLWVFDCCRALSEVEWRRWGSWELFTFFLTTRHPN